MEAPGRVRGMRAAARAREANLILSCRQTSVWAPGRGTFWFQIFIQASSLETWSETISGNEQREVGWPVFGLPPSKNYHANGSDVITPVFAPQPALSTHARKPNLLPLVQRLIEARERGTDRSGGCPHRGEPGAEGRHASDRSERGFGGARAGERVGGFKRGGDKLVENSALRLRESHTCPNLSDWPAAGRPGDFPADVVPSVRGG